jgi:hypothetical protein
MEPLIQLLRIKNPTSVMCKAYRRSELFLLYRGPNYEIECLFWRFRSLTRPGVSRVHCRKACDTMTALRLSDQIGCRTMQVDVEDSGDVKPGSGTGGHHATNRTGFWSRHAARFRVALQ